MDPEQTFLRVHARLSGMLSQLLTPRIRLALEYLYLAGAVALFCLLVVMHTNFVQQVSTRILLRTALTGLPRLFYRPCCCCCRWAIDWERVLGLSWAAAGAVTGLWVGNSC